MEIPLYKLITKLQVALDSDLQGCRIGADNFFNLLPALEQHECGHSTDTKLLSHVCDVINVQLIEVGARIILAVLVDHRGDYFAWATPCGITVKNHKAFSCQGLVKVGFVLNLMDNHIGKCRAKLGRRR